MNFDEHCGGQTFRLLMTAVFDPFKCLNNLDKRNVNFMTYGKVWCTTQGYEIFRTSAGGCLRYEYTGMFVLADATHHGSVFYLTLSPVRPAIWQFLGVTARTNVCAIILT